MNPAKEAPPPTSLLDGPLRVLAAGAPFLLAVSRASSSGQWRGDLPAVRDLGLVAVGIGGGLSTLLTQALTLVPLGSRAFRASLGSTLGLGFAAWLLYGLVLHALRAQGSARRLAPVLASIATLAAALSPTWQREGTLGGGAMLATALVLGAIDRTLSLVAWPARGVARGGGARWVALGGLLGATFAESPPAALVSAASCAALILVHRTRLGDVAAPLLARARRLVSASPVQRPPPAPAPHGLWPTRRVVLAAGCAFAIAAALLLAPLALRPFAPRAWGVDVGRPLASLRLSAGDATAGHPAALAGWAQEVGLVALLFAFAGAALGLGRRARDLVAAFVVLAAADALVPARVARLVSADPLTASRCLAIAAIAAGTVLAVNAAADWLLRVRLPMAKTGAVLVVVFHLTLVALTSEEAGFVADRSEQLAAEEWADAALGALEPRAAVLARTPELVWRLWAARVTRGERPDVLVVPVALLSRSRVAAGLAKADPATIPVLRDVALVGEPSEFALSKLADVRPLHLEMERAWSKRLALHLDVAGMWLGYAPQPLGPSDRKMATSVTLLPMRRVITAARAAVVPDAMTASIVSSTLRDQAEVLLLLGESEAAQAFIDRMGELAPTDPLGGAGWLRLALAGIPTPRTTRAARSGGPGERRLK